MTLLFLRSNFLQLINLVIAFGDKGEDSKHHICFATMCHGLFVIRTITVYDGLSYSWFS